MWQSMLDRVADYRAGSVSLGRLVADLRGLYVEADPHDPEIRRDFEAAWSPIDGQSELRSEAWAPPGAASDATLDRVLNEFVQWVVAVLAADDTSEHG